VTTSRWNRNARCFRHWSTEVLTVFDRYRRQSNSAGIVLGIALTLVPFSTPVHAQSADESVKPEASETAATNPCRDENYHPEGWLDRTHSYVSERLCEPAVWFDGFFGDPRSEEETPVGSFLRLRNSLRWDQSRDFGHDVRLSANIALPRLSRRVRLLISRNDAIEGELDRTDERVDAEDAETRLGLRLVLSDRGRTHFDLDGTLKISSGGPNPQLRGRARHTRELTRETLARLTQTVFWERDDGFGTGSRVDLEWLPDPLSLVRLTGRGTVSEGSDGVDWRSGLIGFRQINRRTAIRSELGAFGYTRPEFEAEEVFINFRFRRAFLREWLFYELQPEYAWPIDDDKGRRGSDWRFILTLEIQFENPAMGGEGIDHYRGR
jgi:hypothetical protein